MVKPDKKVKTSVERLQKCPTGIKGLDEITGGGLSQGCPTLVCGGTGCGKTLLAKEFLVRGATEHDEPGVYMSFEERSEELTQNFASRGFDLNALAGSNKIALDYGHFERSEIEETGEHDLDGLFSRLGHAIDSIDAKRVAIDTIEALFSGFSNETIIRKFFDLPEKGLSDLNKVIILKGGAMEFGILADAIIGTRTVALADLQPSLPTLTDIRADYLKGVTEDRLVVLDGEKLLSDRRIIVHEDV